MRNALNSLALLFLLIGSPVAADDFSATLSGGGASGVVAVASDGGTLTYGVITNGLGTPTGLTIGSVQTGAAFDNGSAAGQAAGSVGAGAQVTVMAAGGMLTGTLELAASGNTDPDPDPDPETPEGIGELIDTGNTAACVEDATTLCLNGDGFEVITTYDLGQAGTGTAQVVELTNDTGYIYFTNDQNVESFIKVLDACAINGKYWVFTGGLTDRGFEATIREVATGLSRTYSNTLGEAFVTRNDTQLGFECNQ